MFKNQTDEETVVNNKSFQIKTLFRQKEANEYIKFFVSTAKIGFYS